VEIGAFDARMTVGKGLLDPALCEKLAPAADRVVVEQKRFGDFLTAPPGVQKHQGVRTPSHPATRDPLRASTISSPRSCSLRKPD
jgi:hypothetical protein